MEKDIPIPPAINERFEREASKVCERAEIDYQEIFVTRQELVVCLQERWRDGSRMGLNDEDSLSRALESFRNPFVVAKSLRKPWWVRFLTTKRYTKERLLVVFFAFFAYSCLVIYDRHWKSLFLNSDTVPIDVFLSSVFVVCINGLGIMLIGFFAVAGVLAAQLQTHFKERWLNRLLSLRQLLLLFTGYALFSLTIRSCYLCSVTLPYLMKEYSSYHDSIVRYCIINFVGMVLGWAGAACLLSEMFECDLKGSKGSITFAGFVLGAILFYVYDLSSKG